MKLTKRMLAALELVGSFGAWGIDADDPRCEQYSDGGQLDTWNRLFEAGLAEQWSVGDSGDEFAIRLTDAGRAALQEGE